MKSVDELRKNIVTSLELEIQERRETILQMVGQLYPSILNNEIILLHKWKTVIESWKVE
jgi:hypothetical protein